MHFLNRASHTKRGSREWTRRTGHPLKLNILSFDGNLVFIIILPLFCYNQSLLFLNYLFFLNGHFNCLFNPQMLCFVICIYSFMLKFRDFIGCISLLSLNIILNKIFVFIRLEEIFYKIDVPDQC